MADRLIHQRVFKVSKELNRLDMLCNQHRRQTGHQDGLPDWEQPHTPAGKASTRHQRTPAFFAWDEASPPPTWQTQTPQKVVRRLDMTPAREREAAEPVPERSPFGSSSEDGRVLPLHVEDEGMDEDSAIEVDSEGEEEQTVDGVRTVAVSPAKEDILDRVAPSTSAAAVQMRTSNPSLTEDASSSPYRPLSSPRYRHGRRLLESDAAVPPSRSRGNAAGVTTEQADRYRMSRSSGKRLRSPAKPTSLWDDLCNSYIHQSSANSTSSSRNASSFSHKRLARTAAERTFGGSSVFPTLNTDTYGWPPREHQSVLTGSDAMNVANHAVREFLGGRDEETKQSEPSVPPRQRSVENGRLVPATEAGEDVLNPGSSNKKSKRVSFGSKITYQQPRTLPVLADKTTQTDDSLLTARSARKQRSDQANEARRYSACDATVGDSERPRKVPRGPENSSGPAQQRNYRRASSSFSQHLTNPILLNPRYPPEPTTFRGRSTYSSAFNDRLAWR